jgi:hypothetical protein
MAGGSETSERPAIILLSSGTTRLRESIREDCMAATTKDFDALFVRLRDAMEPFGADLVVTRDAPGDYYVESGWIRDDGYHGFFGAVRTNKRYVSYHLMPVYAWPDLLDSVSPWLRGRMQGKSCFNFTSVEDDQLTELADLTRRGYERLRDSGADIHPHPRWSHRAH